MTTIVLTIPDEFKSMADALPALVDRVAAAHGRLHAAGGGDDGQVEVDIAAAGAEIERAAHRDLLASLIPAEPFVMIHGAVHRRHPRVRGDLVHAGRTGDARRAALYRPAARPKGKALDPIGLQVGAIGTGWLPQTATAMAFLMQQGTDREAEKTGTEIRRLMYSRGAFASVAHAVGRQVQLHHRCRTRAPHELRDPGGGAHDQRLAGSRNWRMEEPKPGVAGRATKGTSKPRRSVRCAWRMAYSWDGHAA